MPARIHSWKERRNPEGGAYRECARCGGDVLAVLLNVSVRTITRILRYALFIAPLLTWLVAFWVCRWLRTTRVHPGHPTAGMRLRRTPSGRYESIWPDPGSSGRHVISLPGRASSR
jgi:hypothetical protein